MVCFDWFVLVFEFVFEFDLLIVDVYYYFYEWLGWIYLFDDYL